MAVTAVAVLPAIRRLEPSARQQALSDFMRRLARVMWTAFATAGVTGVLNLYFRGVRPGQFLDPVWRAASPGKYIVAKVVLFVTIGALVVLHQRVRHLGQARWLGRLTLGLGIVMVLSALLLVRGA